MNQELISFGLKIRQLRTARGLSQEQLGQQADLDRTYISGIERGVRNLSLLNLFRLAKALGVSPSVFFEEGSE
ncbi:helix-turn-helix domain-containing protein [Chitinibacter sp. GC72]|uniref:helix-turn-helix domain-containing protein n=1 Tax=Chitinibacter sp. GC72 TaxID=1526917 RepID=UPI0012FAD314|nr:helix-turn-helix transcriptional regulator [Chitinibacter sp. GC72]